jgi:hypothetical protein
MSARILEFTRDGRRAQLRISTPIESADVDRMFTLLDKLQRLHRQSPIALRVIEKTIDDLLEPDPESARCAVNGGRR